MGRVEYSATRDQQSAIVRNSRASKDHDVNGRETCWQGLRQTDAVRGGGWVDGGILEDDRPAAGDVATDG